MTWTPTLKSTSALLGFFPDRDQYMNRSATLDYARFLAAVGIIVFHVGAPGASIGYAALPFFIILLIVLAFPAAENVDFRTYAWSRIVRLMRPWAIWSLIYGALKLVEVALTEATVHSEFAPWMLLSGPSLHLWFMPFALAACLAIWPLAKYRPCLSSQGRIICAALGTALAIPLISASASISTHPPFSQWLFALPAVALGAGFGCLRLRPNSIMVAITCSLALAGGLYLKGWPNGSEQLVIACFAFTFCIAVPLPDRPRARWLADLSLTLYLAHPMAISVLTRLTPLQGRSVGLAICAALSTVVLAALLQGRQRAVSDHHASRGAQS